MLSCVVQNFYSENSIISKTLKYVFYIYFKNVNTLNIFVKFYSYFIFNIKNTIKTDIFLTYEGRVMSNIFSFFKSFFYKRMGVWSNNLVKSYQLKSIQYLLLTIKASNPLVNSVKLLDTRPNIHYNRPFKIINFNLSTSLSKLNIIFILNLLSNFNTGYINTYWSYKTFFIYPNNFLFLNFNSNYYFKIRRY